MQNEKETDVLHDEISHQGFGHHEIEEFIYDFILLLFSFYKQKTL